MNINGVSATRNLTSEIPNITGGFYVYCRVVGGSGAFYTNGTGANANMIGTVGTDACWMDASLSSDRYGNYTEVNPLYTSCKFFIKY